MRPLPVKCLAYTCKVTLKVHLPSTTAGICVVSVSMVWNVSLPEDTALVDALATFVPEAPEREAILVHNPLRLLALAAWLGATGDALWGGAFALGPWTLHPLVLVFAASGSAMISKTLHSPKL